MGVRPRPRRVRLSRVRALVPRPADQHARKFGLRVQIRGAARKASSSEQDQRDKNPQHLHESAPCFLTKQNNTRPASRSAIPKISRNASAVPVAGAPKTFSICQPAGNSVGTGTVFDSRLTLATTSSTATKEV